MLMAFGAIVFLVIGIALRRVSPIEMGDFKVVYYSARCLLQHGDPYREADVLRVYQAEGHENPSEPILDRAVKTRFFYPPTAFLFTLPFALLGFSAGKVLWTILLAALLILASILAWDVGADYAPLVSGVLAALLLMNSVWLYMVGNASAFAVSLCVIAAWSFYRERFVVLGVLCLAASLALKPNDSGLVWLFLLLAGPPFRKRAVQTVAALAVLSVPMVIWVAHVSPHWLTELRANMASFFEVGGIVDPAATGMAGRTMDSLVQFQSFISIFFPSPAAYNVISWAVCAPLILVGALFTVMRGRTVHGVWLALAAAAPLSMLPTYHLQHDAKILLLTIPGCAMLWSQGNRVGRLSLLFTCAAIVINGDMFSVIRILLTHSILVPHPNFGSELATAMLTRPAPLILFAAGIFYVWTVATRGALPIEVKNGQQKGPDHGLARGRSNAANANCR
jgi:hypothetical protein